MNSLGADLVNRVPGKVIVCKDRLTYLVKSDVPNFNNKVHQPWSTMVGSGPTWENAIVVTTVKYVQSRQTM
jgi:hypothetical protein